MQEIAKEALAITTKVSIPLSLKDKFIDWQSHLNTIIAAFPGFVSLEILSPTPPSLEEWLIIQRFSTPSRLSQWCQSEQRHTLIQELNQLFDHYPLRIQEEKAESQQLSGGVTEVFVTQVAPGMEKAYREWFAKIHQVEARFPGFRGVYLQSPSKVQGNHWITLLQFDNQTHLDHWLLSPEREKILQESTQFVSSLESHRVISPYAGWFASLKKSEAIPSVWKQTMVVLLVLFPIVMLELKYLSMLTRGMNPALATFIGNAISVTLIAWPFMPIAISCLNWWLSPQHSKKAQATLIGTGIVIFLYLIEIILFWHLL